MERSEVYKLIDSERDYQEAQEDLLGWQKKKTVGEWIVLLNHYVTLTNAAWCTATGDDEALEVIRKLAGIAVHCMEQSGAKPREK